MGWMCLVASFVGTPLARAERAGDIGLLTCGVLEACLIVALVVYAWVEVLANG